MSSENVNNSEYVPVFKEWHDSIEPAISALKDMAGTTEAGFLNIGSHLQQLYKASSEITSIANLIVDSVTGNIIQSLTQRLQKMIDDMQSYLATGRGQSGESCRILEQVIQLLDQVSHHLESFHKMYTTLRMLGISTKIESSRIGELGTGFLTLAMDVEKLSQLVNEKSEKIQGQRGLLTNLIVDGLKKVHAAEIVQDENVRGVLQKTSGSLAELIAINERCNQFGVLVASVSEDVSSYISDVVSSLQAHDITRQQVEHIIEALEGLKGHLSAEEMVVPEGRKLIGECGDVCELQAAQLRHASSMLNSAVSTIIENLQDISGQLSRMTQEAAAITGISDSGGVSFVDAIGNGLSTMTGVLGSCAESDLQMSATMKNVAAMIGEIAGFVADIEGIGSEIDLIALNSQIKAAHTGREGAALGVLAEAIKRLSVDAVTQTEAVSATLVKVGEVTGNLSVDSDEGQRELLSQVRLMESELKEIIDSLTSMNKELFRVLRELDGRVQGLASDVEMLTAGIDVHHKTSEMVEMVVSSLDLIVARARELEPASREFKENLRHMEQRYTMESERHIHESIMRHRSGEAHQVKPLQVAVDQVQESEFGDNVDLF